MMNFFHATILGAIEGITEFLPISSTFHLLVTARMLGLAETDFVKLFQVFIQSGAILAAFFLNLKLVLNNQRLVKLIFLTFLPTAIVGLVFHSFIKGYLFESLTIPILATISIGFVFLLVERFKVPATRKLEFMSYRDAFIIGLAQSLAIVPGVSRAGVVIIFLLLLGYKRRDSAVYSFLVAVPTIFAAGALDLFKNHAVLLQGNNLGLLICGLVVSFITSLITIRWFTGYLERHTLNMFAYYRVILGFILLGIII